MLTVEQAAKIKGLHPSRITQLINAGKILAVKEGNKWMIKEKDLDNARWDSKPGPKAK